MVPERFTKDFEKKKNAAVGCLNFKINESPSSHAD